ncbi:hypothetical protein B5F96_13110 [Parabacteroides johnsonii]|uniref:Uncharacterized protein n=2 Tax=Parabacteroides johnsonii TaxID=387661 RepID=A0A9Q5SQM5_9BACT|nr:hypothetical protein B5F96_13110 [Parabacteroides johnsonii]
MAKLLNFFSFRVLGIKKSNLLMFLSYMSYVFGKIVVYSVISGSDYIIAVTDYIIAATDFIITVGDYRIY